MNYKANLSLHPWWIQGILLLYLLLGLPLIVSLVLLIIGYNVPISLYGITSVEGSSILDVLLIILVGLKLLVGYLSLTGNNYAKQFAIIDGSIGILCCLFTGFIWPFIEGDQSVDLVFRLEMIVLIPYVVYFVRFKSKQ
ncbi:MAG: hypothetical protein KDC28_12510 [Saprospiraceae bacterium]|nr:hypothetical protein [Saprospiraceae bacterium]MCB9318120.1 hypothetical protein [Lewinellaceae bacterium]